MANIKVAVRVRPISQREINVTGSDVVVHTADRELSLTNLKVSSSKAGDSRERTRRYTFDYCFNSADLLDDHYANQERIYETLGEAVLDSIFTGYNACLVAYGQSASGKTYTMMGSKEDPGLIPRICNGIFLRVAESNEKNEESFCISVSYLEVYNERVRDLLKPSTSSNGLRVREHPRLGPYVQGLTQHQVESHSSLMFHVEEGTKARKTASTQQNPSSSRSHALLTLTLEPFTSTAVSSCTTASVQTNGKTSAGIKARRAEFKRGCKLHLVDLAGSENAAACAGINRLKEGANINKSLVALGNVISALAERSTTGNNPARRFIPYRDSALTWLLKDSLGGNATTIMLATISPASGSFNETSHTLRFAQRAQSVINRPVINEDPVAKIIRELRAEVARLKGLLLEKNIQPSVDLKPCGCQPNQEQRNQCFETRCVSTSTSNSPSANSFNVSLTQVESDPTKHNESNSPTTKPIQTLEIIGSIDDTHCNIPLTGLNYKCAKISELTEEEASIEPASVDIPTLVAVLIKPDDSIPSNSHQIEEICSAPEDSIENEFTGSRAIDDLDNEKSDLLIEQKQDEVDYLASFHVVEDSVKPNTARSKPKLRKQQSSDSNLHGITSVLTASRRFGSAETLGKRASQPPGLLQRSQTSLEKRDKQKKLNNIKEVEDRSDNKRDDQSRKESAIKQVKPTLIRKQSIDILKRRTSKDSSSSSSKDDVTTNDAKESRKSSVDSEQPSKPHTIIQRSRRADIVAAVTERLYSSRKTSEDSNTASTPASDIRSPENSEVKLATATRMRLQEISRKMLAKRRRICVDTQTESASTLRVRDKGINVKEPKVVRKDAGVLTDRHENYDLFEPSDTVVRRVKETSTSTADAPDRPFVCYKDAGNLTDHSGNHYDEMCQKDSGILYDDSHLDNSAIQVMESSMNTNLPIEPSCAGVQTLKEDIRTCCTDKEYHAYQKKEIKSCCPPTDDREVIHSDHHNKVIHDHCNHHAIIKQHCCPETVHDLSHKYRTEESIISINLPDMINITIQSPNVLESKIQVFDDKRDTKRDIETQTDKKDGLEIATLTDENFIAVRDSSTTTRLSQTDGRVFRIENIFEDPRCSVQSATTAAASEEISDCYQANNSILLTNSIGTIFSQAGSRDNEKFYDSGLLSPLGRGRKSLTSEWLNKSTWPRWHSPLGFTKRQYNSIPSIGQTDKYTLTSNYFSRYPENADLTSNLSENYSTNMFTRLSEQGSPVTKLTGERTKVIDKLSAGAGVLANEDPRPVSPLIGMIDRKGVYEQETNFSDDSLDPKDDRVRRAGKIKSDVIVKQNDKVDNVNDNTCPPDVVAHTKRDDSLSCQEDVADFFDDIAIDLPRTKVPSGDLNNPVQQFKSMILGVPLVPLLLNAEDQPESMNINGQVNKTTRIGNNKKRVSFGESDTVIEPSPGQSSYAESPKPIIKWSNPESTERKITWKQSSQSNQPATGYSNKPTFDNESKLKKNSQTIMEEYLGEALTFMRNINTINKYITPEAATRRSKDFARNPVRVSYTDSPYEKCLRSMERLEECLSRVKCHDDTEGRYDVKESTAEAKQDLAGVSQEARKLFLTNDDLAVNYNHNVDRYLQRPIDMTDDESTNYNLKTLDRYRRILNTSRIRHSNHSNNNKKRSRSLSSTRIRDCDLDNGNIYPKLMASRMDEDTLIARVKKSLPSPRCSITKYDSSDESSSSDEALAAFIESIDKISRDKFKYPASPRVKFLQLLSERRRIVENSRSTGAS